MRFDANLADAKSALAHLATIGGPEDQRLVGAVLQEQLPKLEVVQRYFKALETGETFTETIPDASIARQLEDLLTTPGAAQAALADAKFKQYADQQRTQLTVVVAMASVGLLLVLVLLIASQIFGRRDALAHAELARLRRVALVDSLTELGNRRAFEEQSEQLAVPNGSPHSVSLAFIDVDEFKTINDTWGHERGDQILRAIADALRANTPTGGSPFRVGGDEFGVLMLDVSPPAAVEAMEELRRSIADDLAPATVSIGIAAMTGTEIDVPLLRQQADAALYEAKLRGRNLSIFYHFSPDSVPVFPASKLQAVRHLLAEGAVTTVFQPIWHLNPRSVLGYEALARPNERYGLNGPQQAFDIAEQFGRSVDLDLLCRGRALTAAANLPSGALLFLNMSPYTLTHHSFSAAAVREEFAAAGLDPSQVVLEISGRSSVPSDAIAHAVRQLKAEGFGIAINDAGRPGTGIELLRRVPFDYIKVNRAILGSAMEGGNGRGAVMAILAFARESNAQVLAQGVETEETLDLVRDLARGPVYQGDLIQLV
ncbi:MAG: bifunctional diguanylate cyclase/phosphodiesterase, partial [Tepidiformaceae bacterium]